MTLQRPKKFICEGTGMLTIAIPILIGVDSTAESSDSGVSERTQYYATAKNLMMSGADAMERLMTSYKARHKKI